MVDLREEVRRLRAIPLNASAEERREREEAAAALERYIAKRGL